MSDFFQDIKYKYARLNVFEKIIVVNVVIFLLSLLLRKYLFWFELPSDFSEAVVKPWTIVTYAFLHYEPLHILFNMLWLYVIGRMFLNLFSAKMALNVYFLGAISGGVLFVTCYSLFPEIFPRNYLVGASAAVRALLIFLCAYMPNQELRVFTFNIKLWYIGAFVVILDLIGVLNMSNPGGNLAHLGGAVLGYLYAKQLHQGKDIGTGFGKFMDRVVTFFKFKKKGPLKTVHKNKSKVGGYTKSDFSEFNDQKKIDVILDKISKSGYDSLTEDEKEYLFRAGK